jgi:hypothetical protein
VRERIFLIKPILKNKKSEGVGHTLKPKELLMAGLVRLLLELISEYGLMVHRNSVGQETKP